MLVSPWNGFGAIACCSTHPTRIFDASSRSHAFQKNLCRDFPIQWRGIRKRRF
jgi:hypothetical protein